MYNPYGPSSSAGFPHSASQEHHQKQEMIPLSSGRMPSSFSPSTTGAHSAAKKPVRDSKRRATHSQIERRRREKINDRLVTLRTIVPACAAEVEERKRLKREEEEEARRIAAGEITAESVARGNGKRKRNRKRAAKKEQDGGGAADAKEEELGLHKLEVLTHAIEYIYELQARIYELETGVKGRVRRLDDDDDQTEIVDDPIEEHHQIRKRLAEEEEEAASEAHVEMSGWRVQAHEAHQQRQYEAQMHARSTSAAFGHRPSATRRSTMSSDGGASTSFTTSPAYPYSFGVGGAESLSDASPFFSATANSSASNFTALTSPMMSLSAESPILHVNNGPTSPSQGSGTAGAKAEQGSRRPLHHRHESSSMSSSERERESGTWHMLPEPAIQFQQQKQARNERQTHHSKHKESDDAAHLLLAFSTSPEVFRPTSAVRQTFVEPGQADGDRSKQRRRLSTTAAVEERKASISPPSFHAHRSGTFSFSRPSTIGGGANGSALTNGSAARTKGFKISLRTRKVDGRSMVMGSAPGGAHPSASSHLLPSPPLLALDDKQSIDEIEDEQMDVDATVHDAL